MRFKNSKLILKTRKKKKAPSYIKITVGREAKVGFGISILGLTIFHQRKKLFPGFERRNWNCIFTKGIGQIKILTPLQGCKGLLRILPRAMPWAILFKTLSLEIKFQFFRIIIFFKAP
jgi:hypothetical protein